MEKELVGILSSLGGVILGFSLSQAAEWYRSNRIKKNLCNSVRHLILLEVRKNHRLLSIYWREVESLAARRLTNDAEVSLASYAYSISETPFPLLSRSGWDAHLSKVTETFSVEEISHIWDFYEDLSQLSTLHRGITHLRDAAHTRGNDSVLPHNIATAMEFESSSKIPVTQFKIIIEGILKYGSAESIMNP